MSAKHTPGPWTAEYVEDECDSQHEVWLTDSRNGYEAHLVWTCDHGADPGSTQWSEADANARLIAAAPELYEALQEMRAACAAAFRVIAENCDATLLEKELTRAGVAEGFGKRAGELLERIDGEAVGR